MLADLALLFCAFVWGTSFATMKILVGVYSSCWLLFLRFTLSSLFILIIFYARLKNNFKQCFKGGVILGTALFLAIATQTLGLNYTDAGKQAFITSIYVLIVPLLLWLFKKVFPGIITIYAAVLCVTGMYFLTGGLDGNFNFNVGDLLTLICAVFFALQILAAWRYTAFDDPVTLSFISFVCVAVFSFISALIFELPLKNIFDFDSIFELIYTALFVTLGGYLVQICAQKYAKPSHASIIMSLESVFGLISGIIFLNESVSLKAAFGCVLIFISVIGSELEDLISAKFNLKRK